MMTPDDYDREYRTGDPCIEEYLREEDLVEEILKPETPRHDLNIKHRRPKWLKNKY